MRMLTPNNETTDISIEHVSSENSQNSDAFHSPESRAAQSLKYIESKPQSAPCPDNSTDNNTEQTQFQAQDPSTANTLALLEVQNLNHSILIRTPKKLTQVSEGLNIGKVHLSTFPTSKLLESSPTVSSEPSRLSNLPTASYLHQDELQNVNAIHSAHSSPSATDYAEPPIHEDVAHTQTTSYNARSEILAASPLGIDTVHLVLPLKPCSVRRDHLLRIVRTDTFRPLFIDSAGELVTGSHARWPNKSDDLVNIRITPAKYFKAGNFITGNGICSFACYITFSVSKISGSGNNTYPANFESFVRAIDYVSDTLETVGITADIWQAILNRLDMFRNLIVSTPSVERFLNVLKQIGVSRKLKGIYSTTNLDFNKSESMSFYDKLCEQGYDLTDAQMGLLRAEWQLKRAKKIRDTLGITTLADLRDRFDLLPVAYARAMSKFYFNHKLQLATVPRNFRRGIVGKRLHTMSERFVEMPWASQYDYRRLRLDLDAYGVSGLSQALKEAAKTANKSEREWLNTRLRELRSAVIQELLQDSEFFHHYTQLRDWLTDETLGSESISDSVSAALASQEQIAA